MISHPVDLIEQSTSMNMAGSLSHPRVGHKVVGAYGAFAFRA